LESYQTKFDYFAEQQLLLEAEVEVVFEESNSA
jgi:hypothetical protein